MHSFHPSRGRILFEVFGALVVSASCVGTWMQTGAWAMLPAAFVALLWGLIHAFDMARPRTAAAVEPQRIDFTIDLQDEPAASQDDRVGPALVEQPQESAIAVGEADPVKPAAPKADKGRRAKAPRKGGARVASSSVKAKGAEPASPVEAEVSVPAPHEETAHHSLAPLFEPEPFARQRHAVFGRKAS